MIKIMLLLHRRPDLSVEDFRRYWHTEHQSLLVRLPGLWSLNACRIVYVTDEEGADGRRFGFAYGTLADHMEAGEERFMVEWRREDGSVWYDLLAFSIPRHPLARLAAPLSRRRGHGSDFSLWHSEVGSTGTWLSLSTREC